MKFYIHAEFLDTKLLFLLFRRLPEQARTHKYIYGNFANFNHGLLSKLHAERTMGCKMVYFTRQRFACIIIDAKTLRSLFVYIPILAVALRAYSFRKCILIRGTCPLQSSTSSPETLGTRLRDLKTMHSMKRTIYSVSTTFKYSKVSSAKKIKQNDN